MKIRLANPLEADSIVDGPGLRAVIWTQGCKHNCKGCHNPHTHSFKGGYLTDTEELKKEISSLMLIEGITLSGGDPIEQVSACLDIAKYCKQNGLSVWCWTGYTYEELMDMCETNKELLELLENIDVIVDGRFELEKRSLDIKFRGSTNQRLIDMRKSMKQGKIVLLKEKNKEVKKEQIFI